MPSRPGTVHVKRLLEETSDSLWLAALKSYPEAVAVKSKTVKDGEKLIEDDTWWRTEWGGIIKARKEPHITKEELVRLMEWKLARGKWRPLLNRLKSGNSAENVIKVSTKAFQLADKDTKTSVKDSIKTFSQLACVGPATASGILAIYNPDKFCFMSDEPLEAIKSNRQYTLSYYVSFNEELRTRAKQVGLSVHEAEQSLWACAILGFDPATASAHTNKRKNISRSEEMSETRVSRKRTK